MSFNLKQLIYLITFLSFFAIKCTGHDEVLQRQKRVVAYPLNSCTGVLVAMAIPLGLENRNVFVSYNFEANYNMPTSAPDLVPGPLKRLEYLVDAERSLKGNRTSSSIENASSSFISRTRIYKLLESKISGLNLNGHKCLLRLICEVAKAKESLFAHNGVIGDLMKILLTPSTTPAEGLYQYEDAETAGNKGDCHTYRNSCGVNLLNYFSSVLKELK